MKVLSLLTLSASLVGGFVSAGRPRNDGDGAVESASPPHRPAGHETKPYKDDLIDPYKGFSDGVDPYDVLGE